MAPPCGQDIRSVTWTTILRCRCPRRYPRPHTGVCPRRHRRSIDVYPARWRASLEDRELGFLKRLLGGGARDEPSGEPVPFDPAAVEAEEREHELDILRSEQERLDELAQRQLRYARYAWQPPSQGGDRRADDQDKPEAG